MTNKEEELDAFMARIIANKQKNNDAQKARLKELMGHRKTLETVENLRTWGDAKPLTMFQKLKFRFFKFLGWIR